MIPKVYYNFIQNIIHRPFSGHLARTYAYTHTHTDRSTNAYNKTLLILRGVVREKKPPGWPVRKAIKVFFFFFYYIAVEFGQTEMAERRIFVGRKSCERERDGVTSLNSQGSPPAAGFFHKAFVKLCPRPVRFFENIIIYILTTTVRIPK